MNNAYSTANENLMKTVIRLIHNQPFYAALIQNMRREFSTRVPTLGVSVTDAVNIIVNPYFFNNLTEDGREAVLIHEALHVVNNHFSRFKDLEPKMYEKKDRSVKEMVEDYMNASCLNKAADAAINEFIPNLPKKFNLFDKEGNAVVEPDTMQDKDGKEIPNPKAGQVVEAEPVLVDSLRKTIPNIENRKHTEYYYDLMKEDAKKNGKNKVYVVGAGKGDGQGSTIDDHNVWGEGGDQDSEYMTEKVKQTVNKAVEQCGGREAGNIPSNVLQAIERLNYKPKDWRGDLQKFVARTAEILIESNRKIRNRRYGILYPGNKVYPKLNLALLVDTSGSVNDECLNQAFAEIDKIHKSGVNITVVEFDAVVQQTYEFDPRKKVEIKGRGGTMFWPAIKKAEELGVDGMIMLTDGCNCDHDDVKKPKIPMLWALYENCQVAYKWGSRTTIVINKKK